MNDGAQPVFYVTQYFCRDMGLICDFITDQEMQKVIPKKYLYPLTRHYHFMQYLSEGPQTAPDAFYYEREWRLCGVSLGADDVINNPNERVKKYLAHETPLHRLGRLVNDNDSYYYSFKPEDVAFIISPEDWISKIENPNGFEIKSYEELTR